MTAAARYALAIVLTSSVLVPGPTIAQSAKTAACPDWRQCRDMAVEASARDEFEAAHDLVWRAVQTGPRNDPSLMYLLARMQALSGRAHDALVMLRRLAEMNITLDAMTHEDFERVRQHPEWPELAARISGGTAPAPTTAAVGDTSSARAATRPAPSVSPAPSSASPPSPSTIAPAASVTASKPVGTPAPATSRVPAAPAAPSAAPGLVSARSTPQATGSAATSSSTASTTAVAATAATARTPAAVAPPAALSRATATPGVAGSSARLALTPPLIGEPVRFSAPRFTVAGLAYDAVSKRFLFGDRQGRKLVVVGEGTESEAADLVRADSAGFEDISALEIDARRGDLWVASAAENGGGLLHRLQLVSGRPLRTYAVPDALGPATLRDLAITPRGVLVLDAQGGQILLLKPGAAALERVLLLDVPAPTALAAGAQDGVAYVAHRDGISRVDLGTKKIANVRAPTGVSLGGFERVRWHGKGVIALGGAHDGTPRLVQLDLNAGGTTVTRVRMVHSPVPTPAAGQLFAIVSGDELVYVTAASGAEDGTASPADQRTDYVAFRTRLP